MEKRKALSQRSRKLVWQEAGNMCALCQNNDVDVLEIHHIIERSNQGSDKFENLILLCSNCHSKATVGTISVVEVFQAKVLLRTRLAEAKPLNNVLPFRRPSNTINVSHSTNLGIIANSVEFTTQRKSIKVTPPIGTIGSDRYMSPYIDYLIKTYQDCGQKDFRFKSFSYPVLYASIQRKFKCKWQLIPIERFEELARFLQNKISKTTFAMGLEKRGITRYSSFEEFWVKQGIEMV